MEIAIFVFLLIKLKILYILNKTLYTNSFNALKKNYTGSVVIEILLDR